MSATSISGYHDDPAEETGEGRRTDMGIRLTANHSSYVFYMGYGGFFSLRKNIALALDREFGEHYAGLIYCHTPADFDAHDRRAEQIITEKRLDERYTDVLDFLYAPDAEGVISHATAGKIYELIKNTDFQGRGFRYAAERRNDYEELKLFLRECRSTRRKVRWN